MYSTKASLLLSEYQTRARAAIRAAYETEWMIPILSGAFTIITKDARKIRFRPNIIQLQLLKKISELRKNGIPIRMHIPKARQHGVTTLLCAIGYSTAAFRQNRSCLILADKKEKSVPIFDKVKLMHNSIDPSFRTETGRSNTQELIFTENNSVMRVGTAGSEDTGRSQTYQFFHGSEVAFYQNAETVMLGIMQTIPDIPDTMAFFESTGNGMSGWFYDECTAAEQGRGNSQLFFIPWWQNPEYMKQIPDNYILIPQPDGQWGDEIQEQQAYGLSVEQLYWRRNYIDNYCGRDLFKFKQEYPGCMKDAFLASGFPVFNQLILEQIDKTMTTYPRKEAIFIRNEIHFTSGGWLKIWQMPLKDYTNRYAIFADTGGKWSGADYYSAHVYDRINKEIVATIHEHFEPYEFAKFLFILGKFYDTALVCIEVNRQKSETESNGISVLDNILQKYRYPNLYVRNVYDQTNKYTDTHYGFHTTAETKQLLIDRGLRYVNQESTVIKINDKDTVHELKTFVVLNTDGKATYGASEKAHDDRVISFLGVLLISDDMPEPRKRPSTAKKNKSVKGENPTEMLGR